LARKTPIAGASYYVGEAPQFRFTSRRKVKTGWPLQRI
jgi:hypothetical protein